MTITPTERVCPDCGQPAGQQPLCASCGTDLSTRDELPTRAEWEAGEPAAHGPEFVPPHAPGGQPPPTFGAQPPSTMAGFGASADQQLPWHQRPMAAWGYRVGATLTNVALAVLVGVAAAGVALAAGAGDDDATTVGMLTILGAWLINAVIIAAVTNGQSLGKKLAGIRVIRENGRPYGIGTALVRDVICRLIYVVPLVWLIDVLIPLGAERQTLRDRMVATRVMQEPVYRSRRWPLAATAAILTCIWFALVAGTDALETTDTYTGLDREVFINGCTEEGEFSDSECGCVFDYISARLPYDEYQEADRQDLEDWSPRVNRIVADGFSACTNGPAASTA